MGFWIFMLAMTLLLPVTMIGFGRMFCHRPPEEINGLFGYRTPMSMVNKDTWAFAHRFCGRLWRVVGWILLPVSVVPMVLVLGREADTVGTVGAVVTMLQLIPMMGCIVPTEIALRKTFHPDGSRK